MRLVEGHHRVPDPRPKRRSQTRLAEFLDRRQPRHPRVARICASGRRGGARHADPRRGGGLGGIGRGVQRRQQRHHAQTLGTDDDLRQGRRGRRQARTAEGHQAQGPEGLENRRQAIEAARHRRQGQWQAGLRVRPQIPRYADRHDPRLPDPGRQGEELRRRQGRGHARGQKNRAGRRHRRRGRCRQLLGTPRPRSPPCRSCGTRAPTQRSAAPRLPTC